MVTSWVGLCQFIQRPRTVTLLLLLLLLCTFKIPCFCHPSSPFKVAEWCADRQAFHIEVRFSETLYEDFFLYDDGTVINGKNLCRWHLYDKLVMPKTRRILLTSPSKMEDLSDLPCTSDLSNLPTQQYSLLLNFEWHTISGNGVPNYASSMRRWYLGLATGISLLFLVFWIYNGIMDDTDLEGQSSDKPSYRSDPRSDFAGKRASSSSSLKDLQDDKDWDPIYPSERSSSYPEISCAPPPPKTEASVTRLAFMPTNAKGWDTLLDLSLLLSFLMLL